MRIASVVVSLLFTNPATAQVVGTVEPFELATSVSADEAAIGIGFHAGNPLDDPTITAYYMRAAFAAPPAGAKQEVIDKVLQNGIYFVLNYSEENRVKALTKLCEQSYDAVLARVRQPSTGTQPYAALLAGHKPRYYRVDVSFGLRALRSRSTNLRFAKINPISQVFRVDQRKCKPVTIAPSVNN